MPQKACEREFIHVMFFFIFLERPQKSKSFNFGSLSVLYLVKCFFLEIPEFQYISLKYPIKVRMGEMGHFEETAYSKWGISWKKYVTSLKTENKPKLKLFKFWGISWKIEKPSREKNLSHAFWDISRYLPYHPLCLYSGDSSQEWYSYCWSIWKLCYSTHSGTWGESGSSKSSYFSERTNCTVITTQIRFKCHWKMCDVIEQRRQSYYNKWSLSKSRNWSNILVGILPTK